MRQLTFRIDGLSEDTAREIRKLNHSQGISFASVGVVVAAAAIVYGVTTHSYIRSQVIQQADVTVWEATQALRQARLANANGDLVIEEAVDKARVIKQAASAD